MPDTRTPLTGDAAREALKDIIESTKYAEGYSPEMTAALLATGQVAVYAPEESACVAESAAAMCQDQEALEGDSVMSGSCSRHKLNARALHAAGLCSCRADALLRRGGSAVGNVWFAWRDDVDAYLAERDR